MLLHFVVISVFNRNAGDTKLGPKESDVARDSQVEMMSRDIERTFRMAGIKPGKPQDPMWYLMSHDKFVGYVKVFREERYARNWFRDLSEKDTSPNAWAYWRNDYPIMLIEGASGKDANQFVKYIAICRVRAFSAQSAAENAWKNWSSGNLTAIEIFLDEPRASGGRSAKASKSSQVTLNFLTS
jgi:hypothetical protein